MTKLPIVDDFTDSGEMQRSAFLLLTSVLTLLGLGAIIVFSASSLNVSSVSASVVGASVSASGAGAIIGGVLSGDGAAFFQHLVKILVWRLGTVYDVSRRLGTSELPDYCRPTFPEQDS